MIGGIDRLGEIISDWAQSEPLIRRVYLFGSRARGDHRPDSDIDLALLTNIDANEHGIEIDSKMWADGVPTPETRFLARHATFEKHAARWRSDVSALFPIPVHVERYTRTFDVVMRPSMAQCRIRLFPLISDEPAGLPRMSSAR